TSPSTRSLLRSNRVGAERTSRRSRSEYRREASEKRSFRRCGIAWPAPAFESSPEPMASCLGPVFACDDASEMNEPLNTPKLQLSLVIWGAFCLFGVLLGVKLMFGYPVGTDSWQASILLIALCV